MKFIITKYRQLLFQQCFSGYMPDTKTSSVIFLDNFAKAIIISNVYKCHLQFLSIFFENCGTLRRRTVIDSGK